MNKNELSNKVILLTGAGKGIGRYLVDSLRDKGGYVYAVTRSKQDLKDLKNKKNIKVYYGDVRNFSLIKKIFKHSQSSKNYINSIINNAGIRQREQFVNLDQKKLKEVFEVNFFSIFEIMKIFAIFSKKNKLKGSIVNVGSIVGETGFDSLSGYSASKGALKSLTMSFAVEFAKKNIRANIINPGFTETSYFHKFKKKKKLYNWTINKIPMGRWGKPREIANLVEFLISDSSSYITGESINIDGGWLNS
jgi:3-oxoacyl-[acyl-carrier protein] reductase